MTTNQGPDSHIDYLDGWRGIAIIFVLIGHFTAWRKFGGLGVSIFFVLSGLLMCRILFVKQTPLPVFYRRRAARILPAFFVYVAAAFFGIWYLFGKFELWELLATATFLRTYFEPAISTSLVPISHFWSLNVEEHSYVLLSLLSVLAIRRGERAARLGLTACALLCVVFFLVYKVTPGVPLNFPVRSEVAAFPLLLSCAIFMWQRRFPLRLPQLTAVLTLLLAVAVQLSSSSIFLTYMLVSPLVALSINTLPAAPKWFLAGLSHPLLRWFGRCSFSIYLWQQPFYYAAHFADRIPYHPAVAVPAALVVASVSYYWIETPMRKLIAGRSDAARPVVAAAAP